MTEVKMLERGKIEVTWWTQAKGVLPDGRGWTPDQQIEAVSGLHLAGLGLWPHNLGQQLLDAKLTCPLVSPDYSVYEGHKETPPFAIGIASSDAEFEVVTREFKRSLAVCKQFNFPAVIAFTGMGKWGEGNATDEKCIERLKILSDLAAAEGKRFVLEHLSSEKWNTGVLDHMKGHPGYLGDDLNRVANLVRKTREAGATNVGLLFDVYHVERMHPGRVIELMQEHYDLIEYVHFANPDGRTELYLPSRIDIAEVAAKLAERGYAGYSGIEFVPSDPDLFRGISGSARVLTGEAKRGKLTFYT